MIGANLAHATYIIQNNLYILNILKNNKRRDKPAFVAIYIQLKLLLSTA